MGAGAVLEGHRVCVGSDRPGDLPRSAGARCTACRPDDVGTTELVEIWRAGLFGDHGTLNDKLIGAAA
jgi:hypothetical protein